MSELTSVIITTSGAILIGLIIYACERFLENLCIEPIHKQKEAIVDSIEKMIYHAHFFASPGNTNMTQRKKAQEELRKCATILHARTYGIPLYSLFVIFFIVPSKKKILNVCKCILGLSNGIIIIGQNANNQQFIQDLCLKNLEWQKEIEKLLKIKHL